MASFVFIQDVGDELVICPQASFALFSQSSSFLTRPTCGHLIPHISTIVPLTTYASILCGFLDPLSSFLCVGIATMSYILHLYTFFRESITAFVFFRRIPIPWHATCFRNPFMDKKGWLHLSPVSSWPSHSFLSGTRPTFLLLVFSS